MRATRAGLLALLVRTNKHIFPISVEVYDAEKDYGEYRIK